MFSRRIRELLETFFDEGELRTLCFDLGIDYDGLPGESKADRARELVGFAYRHGRAFELLEQIKQRRPNVGVEALLTEVAQQRTQPTVGMMPVRVSSGRTGPLREDYRELVRFNLDRVNRRVDELDKRLDTVRMISMATFVIVVFTLAGVAAILLGKV